MRNRSYEQHDNRDGLTGQQKNDKDYRFEKVITDLIHDVGIPANIQGYYYVRSAIEISLMHEGGVQTLTKDIYPAVADLFNTTPVRVERSIRHAIEVAWTRGRIETLEAIFGYSIQAGKGRPTNSEFIALLTDKIRIETR